MGQGILQESDIETVKKRYLFFAEHEARGSCPIYENLGLAIAKDPDLLALIATFPKNKRQPNLTLAALRKFLGYVPTYGEARHVLLNETSSLKKIIFSHNTQTNEPGRCATLLPVLCQLPQPLALLEIGASAGLCLIPDIYNYSYGNTTLTGTSCHSDFVLECAAARGVPIPFSLPEVVWRAGLDINPLNINDPEDRAWLELLVWPSEKGRLNRLRAAMDLVKEQDLVLEKGDLHSPDLDALVKRAPKDATLVIYHSAVLAYTLEQARRDAFAHRINEFNAHWLSNESPLLFTDFGSNLVKDRPGSHFLTALNGHPTAWSDPHGASLCWIDHSS